MKRHPALIPLSHDHHAKLVQARRLRLASGSDVAEARLAASIQFVAAFPETAHHFRLEEEQLFPLLLRSGGGGPLLDAVLDEHEELRSLAAALGEQAAANEANADTMARLAALLEEHVRREERELFPLIENTVRDEHLRALGVSSSITADSDEGGEEPCLAPLVCPECGTVGSDHRVGCSRTTASRD